MTFRQLIAPLSEQASVDDAVKCSKVRYAASSSPRTQMTSEVMTTHAARPGVAGAAARAAPDAQRPAT